MHVIVVGAGVGGLTLALALGRAGIETTLVEQAAAFGAVGAGLQLSPNATRALAFLGLEDEVRAIGFAPERVQVRDHRTGRLRLENRLGAAAAARWGAPYLQVHRADLHAVLRDAAERTGKARFKLNARVVDLDVGVAGFGACAVVTDAGERLAGEVVVGCDGVRSAVATALFGAAPARFTGQVAWRSMVAEDRLPAQSILSTPQVWIGPRRHFVCYPVGDGAAGGGRRINFVAVTEETAWRIESWSEQGDPKALLEAFEGWPPTARALIAEADAVWRWALYDRPPRVRWSKDVATLLGDAAHPMLPFLAQGAAMAIEDAVVLARALAQTLASNVSVNAALACYERARRPRTAKVQAWSRRNAKLFHLPGPLAAGAFGAAAVLDRFKPGGGADRFDWLYGYDAATALL